MSSVTDDDLWIRRYHFSPDSAIRLICLPHAGGSANYYFSLSASLAPLIEVLAVQYPGRQDRHRERPLDDLFELADAIFGALRRWSDRPFAFFGHSMGAVLAFEIAQRYQREGLMPLRLFVSGRCAPSRHRSEEVHLKDDDGVVAELHAVGRTEAAVLCDRELLSLILPAVRSDFKAVETYRYIPGPRLMCGITALIGTSDPKVTVDEVSAWADHCAGGFELRTFPGGHFYLDYCQAQVIDTILASLRTAWKCLGPHFNGHGVGAMMTGPFPGDGVGRLP